MKIFKVTLNAWTSPCFVQAMTQKRAKERALEAYPTCDCCGAKTHVVKVEEAKGLPPFNQSVLMEVK